MLIAPFGDIPLPLAKRKTSPGELAFSQASEVLEPCEPTLIWLYKVIRAIALIWFLY